MLDPLPDPFFFSSRLPLPVSATLQYWKSVFTERYVPLGLSHTPIPLGFLPLHIPELRMEPWIQMGAKSLEDLYDSTSIREILGPRSRPLQIQANCPPSLNKSLLNSALCPHLSSITPEPLQIHCKPSCEVGFPGCGCFQTYLSPSPPTQTIRHHVKDQDMGLYNLLYLFLVLVAILFCIIFRDVLLLCKILYFAYDDDLRRDVYFKVILSILYIELCILSSASFVLP